VLCGVGPGGFIDAAGLEISEPRLSMSLHIASVSCLSRERATASFADWSVAPAAEIAVGRRKFSSRNRSGALKAVESSATGINSRGGCVVDATSCQSQNLQAASAIMFSSISGSTIWRLLVRGAEVVDDE
jgi:hypothetical protein